MCYVELNASFLILSLIVLRVLGTFHWAVKLNRRLLLYVMFFLFMKQQVPSGYIIFSIIKVCGILKHITV